MTNVQRMTNDQCQNPNASVRVEQSSIADEASDLSGNTPGSLQSHSKQLIKFVRCIWSLFISHSLVIGRWSLVISAFTGLGYLLSQHRSPAGSAIESPKQKLVKVLTKKEGNLTRFFVDNREAGD